MGINGVLEKAMMGTAVRKAPLEKALTADVSAKQPSAMAKDVFVRGAKAQAALISQVKAIAQETAQSVDADYGKFIKAMTAMSPSPSAQREFVGLSNRIFDRQFDGLQRMQVLLNRLPKPVGDEAQGIKFRVGYALEQYAVDRAAIDRGEVTEAVRKNWMNPGTPSLDNYKGLYRSYLDAELDLGGGLYPITNKMK
jgi:hypothetical protein